MNKSKTIVIAHRGACAYAPENTIAAFQKAAEFGADGIEFDVKCTKDGNLIIIHDQTVDRTTNGSGKVKNLSIDEIQKLDAGSFFSSEFSHERIPQLRDVLEKFSGKLMMNIELTNYSTIGDGLAKKVALLIKELGVEKVVFFSSFHPYNLLISKRVLPQVPVALLALPGKFGWLSRSNLMRWISPEMIHPHYKDVNREYIEKQHRKNRKVNVWTINEEKEIRKMLNINIDGLITDDPVLGRRIVDR